MNLQSFIEKLNTKAPFSGSIKFDEYMSAHTMFKTGGKADLFVKPDKKIFPVWIKALFSEAEAEGIPVFILGMGANLLVSDKGIRGIVLDTGSWKGIKFALKNRRMMNGGFSVKVLSGTSVEKLTNWLAQQGLSGLEFLAGMPGSVGGALWMNARCYGKSVSDVLIETEILDEERNIIIVPFCEKDFSYKKSPFQNRKVFILSARFGVEPLSVSEIQNEMEEHCRDREEKGHYRFPSAGSVFRNNHAFGEPTGKIIDDLGLRGLRRGDAQIAPWHGNIIINTGNASSADIRSLIDEVIKRVREERNFELEPEVIFAGEW